MIGTFSKCRCCKLTIAPVISEPDAGQGFGAFVDAKAVQRSQARCARHVALRCLLVNPEGLVLSSSLSQEGSGTGSGVVKQRLFQPYPALIRAS